MLVVKQVNGVAYSVNGTTNEFGTVTTKLKIPPSCKYDDMLIVYNITTGELFCILRKPTPSWNIICVGNTTMTPKIGNLFI